MPVTVKIDPVDQDIKIMINGMLSPEAQSAAFADFARGAELDAEATNQAALGYVPPHKTVVDGTEGSEDNVRPNGSIVYEFQLLDDLFIFIDETLIQHSPLKSGRYARSHVLYADGVAIDPTGEVPPASEYVFANTQPYARKIEKGESPQFPDGVYEATAFLARARFGNLAQIGFTYRSVNGGEVGAWASSASALAHAERHHRRGNNAASWLTNQPAIVITVR